MLEYPSLRQGTQERTTISQFGGIDWRVHPAVGSCADTQNIKSAYPCMQVQPALVQVTAGANITDVIDTAYGQITIVAGAISLGQTALGTVQDCHHQWAIMGHRVILLPDKVLIDCKTEEILPLEVQTEQAVTITENTITLAQTAAFAVGDGITLSGCTHEENNKTAVVQEIDGKKLTFYANCFTPETGTINLSRNMPDLTHLCVHNNRVWGVYDDKICCCKLGDPTNWQVFDGLSTDAYELQIATAGAFTGCASYGTKVLFFKEDCVHKIFGDKPSNFQQSVGHFDGVQAGCADSLVLDNEVLYWWSRQGLVQYEGGVPICISTALGEDDFTCTAMAVDGHILWMLLQAAETSQVCTFDLHSRVLLVQGLSAVTQIYRTLPVCFGTAEGVCTVADTVDSTQPWHMTFNPILREVETCTFPQRITVLVDVPQGSGITVELARDGGDFAQIFTVQASKTYRKLRIPLVTGRCQQVQVRLSGTGDMTLRHIILTSEKGSDR